MIGNAGNARVHVGATKFLRGDHLAGGGLHQGRTAEKDGALVPDDDRLVAHRRHVGAAGGARPHHHGHLRNTLGGHVRLVEEDAAEVLAIGKHVVLVRQIGPARVHQVDARQAILLRDLLRAQVLLHRHRIVGAPLDGGIVRHHDALASAHPPDAGNDARPRRLVVVHAPRGELRQLQEWRTDVQQLAHALARQQLAPGQVLLACRLAAAQADARHLVAQIRHQRSHGGGVGAELLATGIQLRMDQRHRLGEYQAFSGASSGSAAPASNCPMAVSRRSGSLSATINARCRSRRNPSVTARSNIAISGS